MAYDKNYYQLHKDKITQSQRKYRLNHPDTFKKYRQYQKTWLLKHPGYHKQWLLAHSTYDKKRIPYNSEYMRNWYLTLKQSPKYQEYAERRRKRGRDMQKHLKFEVIYHYSNGKMKCARCGFDDIRALQLDHINGGGTQHRLNAIKSTAGHSFYTYLKKNNYPNGLQVLCANCNWIKRYQNNENFHNPQENSL